MHVLIVRDDDHFRISICTHLADRGHEVREVASLDGAMKAAREHSFAVAIVDSALPGMDGMEPLRLLKQASPETEIILLASDSSSDHAVEAVSRGAFACLNRSCSLDTLTAALLKAEEHGRLTRENLRLRAAMERNSIVPAIIGQSPEIRRLLQMIENAGPTESSVLIVGEQGTGKELMARTLHGLSRRVDRPLVRIDCAALQLALLEGELFGQETGTADGAAAAGLGLFEIADGGTLLIDEPGELPRSLQAKLLNVLETGNLRPTGSIRDRRVDVRVIAASSRDLREDVRAGRFREDLYRHISVLTIEVPPLRDRREDIPLLIDHFLQRSPRQTWSVVPEVTTAFMQHDWPGNVRELANVIERATIVSADADLHLSDFPPPIGTPGLRRVPGQEGTAEEPDNLAERERRHVASVLAREGGSKVRAAAALGISRRSLYRLIEKYDLKDIGLSGYS